MDKKIFLFTEDDMDIISKNLDNIIEQAKIKQIHTIDPKIDEYKRIMKTILEFIKKEKRIIYGGIGWNLLLKKKDPSSCFYKETDYADVEFYSNKPIHDLKKLCDILYINNKYVQGRNAQHEQTYKIFVNFVNYCDITYMPSNLFINVNIIKISDLKIIDPLFIYIDLLRVFTEPLTSYFRLDKNINRGRLLFKNYPLDFNKTNISIKKIDTKSLDIIKIIIEYIISSNTFLFIGQIAYEIYVNNSYMYNDSILEVISIDLINDIKNIYYKLFKHFLSNNDIETFSNNITLDQYYPFFQFLDKKVIFKYNGNPIIIIYGNNEKCIPFNKVKFTIFDNVYNINIGTFNVCLMYNIILFYKNMADDNNELKKLYEPIICNLLQSRNKFFKTNNKNILDDTIYKDFSINCIGNTVDFMRKFHLARKKKKFISFSSIPSYDPDENKVFNPDNYSFMNISGHIINNPKDKIFIIKRSDLE